MKRLILIPLLFCITIFCHGQKFVVTAYGLKDALNTRNSYVVIPRDSTSAEDLYNITFKYINEHMIIYSGRNAIKSHKKGKHIRLGMYVPEIMTYRRQKVRGCFDILFKFKDDKVRFEIQFLSMNTRNSGYEVVISGDQWSDNRIFNEYGELIKKDEKKELESFINRTLMTYVKYLILESPVYSLSEDDW